MAIQSSIESVYPMAAMLLGVLAEAVTFQGPTRQPRERQEGALGIMKAL